MIKYRFLMNKKATQISLAIIVSSLAIAMLSVAAIPFIEQQHAKALNFKLGRGSFIHINPNHHINLKIDGFHIVR